MKEFSKPTNAGLRSTFRQMVVGETICIWMQDYKDCSVSQAASLAGRDMEGRFSVHRDWEGKRFIVTRKA